MNDKVVDQLWDLYDSMVKFLYTDPRAGSINETDYSIETIYDQIAQWKKQLYDILPSQNFKEVDTNE